jgi:RNA polymerase sigma-70 factor (ECF subfamily)
VERHFVAYFSDLLLIKLRKSLRSAQSIEDIRQETFLRAFRVLRQGRGIEAPEKLGAFVNGVCNNVLAEHFRSAARHPGVAEQNFDTAEPGPDPETECVNEERKRSVRQIIEKLPSKDRQILRMIFLEERDKDEVCRACNVNRNHLRVLLHRAKNHFREGMFQRIA